MRPRVPNGGFVGRNRWVLACILVASLCPAAAVGADAVVLGVRHGTGPEHTRVVLDCDGRPDYTVERDGPDRLVVVVRGARLMRTAAADLSDGRLAGYRAEDGPDGVRVALALAGPFRHRAFLLEPEDGRPYRLVVDVLAERLQSAEDPSEAAQPEKPPVRPIAAAPRVVVLDPGHGGLDPGAVYGDVREKDIALDLARRMARLVDARPGHSAVLTRDADEGVGLGDRVRRARGAEGAVFVSIHVNADASAGAAGLDAYVLSLTEATDREAQALADRENAADLVGLPAAGTAEDEDEILEILMDLRTVQVLAGSGRLAENVLGAVRRGGPLQANGLHQADFRVLRSLAMPSVLLQVGYLSNAEDRNVLRTSRGRQDLAETLVAGVLAFLDERGPGATTGKERR